MSRTLLVDMGNSRLKWAWDQPVPLQQQQAGYESSGLAAVCDRLWQDVPRPDQVWLSCVTGQAEEFSDWCVAHWGLRPHVAESAARWGGLVSGYEEPQCLGVDRWLAMIAARSAYPQEALCIVDLGTAVTLDMVNAGGQHLGGYILPGLAAMRDCLRQRTGLRPGKVTATGYGHDTGSAVQLGIHAAVLGLIDRALNLYQVASGARPRLVITGGDARPLLPHLHQSYEWRPALVLEGLACLAEEN